MAKIRKTSSVSEGGIDAAGCCNRDHDDTGGSIFAIQELPAEIREHIIKFLPQKDLISCRLVNRQWKVEANSVLRCRKDFVFAKMKQPCQDLISMDLYLTKFKFEVINGLEIYMESKCCCIKPEHLPAGRSVDGYLSDRLGTVPWKSFNLGGFRGFGGSHCPAWKMISKILGMAAKSLEELSLDYDGIELMKLFLSLSFTESNTENSIPSFPRLRRIWAQMEGTTNDIEVVLPLLLTAAPNLSEIDCMDAYNRDFGSAHNAVMARLSGISYFCPVSPKALRKFVRSEPRTLKVLELEDCCSYVYHNDHFDSTVQLLHWNRNSLQELRICAFDLVAALESLELTASSSLMTFPKVRKLSLELMKGMEESSLRLLRRINPGQLFPALAEAELHVHYSKNYSLHDELDRRLRESEENSPALSNALMCPSRAHFIKLTADLPRQIIPTYDLLGQIFTHVTSMEIFWGVDSLNLSEMFVAFPKLEELKLCFWEPDSDNLANPGYVDAALTGLSCEEVQVLQNLSATETLTLTDLSVVPIRPSLNHLERLKQLELDITDLKNSAAEQLSEVAGILAFSRLPQLSVNLKANFHRFQDVRRVRPYISQAEVAGLDKVL